MNMLVAILIALVSILLILIVLIQKPKGGGLSSSFGGGGSSNMMGGVKQTNQFLDRGTWVLATALLVLVLTTNVGVATSDGEERPQDVTETVEDQGNTGGFTPNASGVNTIQNVDDQNAE